jgi:hypothetical protein
MVHTQPQPPLAQPWVARNQAKDDGNWRKPREVTGAEGDLAGSQPHSRFEPFVGGPKATYKYSKQAQNTSSRQGIWPRERMTYWEKLSRLRDIEWRCTRCFYVCMNEWVGWMD